MWFTSMQSQRSRTSRLGTPVGDVTLIGYILPPPPERTGAAGDEGGDEDCHSEEEEERQPEFLDMSEMEIVQGGGHRLRSSLPPRCEVAFQDMVSGKQYQVEGRFALRSPWWEVTCVARRWGNKHVVQGYPSYRLRLDLDVRGWRPLVSLFLNACDVRPPKFLVQFFKWLPPDRHVSLLNLAEVLDEFERGGNVGAAQCLRARYAESAVGMQVQAASYPLVMKHLPTLLPGLFLQLLQDEDHSWLHRLEQMLATTDVWKLGFSYVMREELQLLRCEAQLQAFIDRDLLGQIPPLQRTALRAYDQLKKHCCRTGSTYMDQQLLCDRLRRDVGAADWDVWDAVEFLRTQGVLVVDRQKKVSLHNLYAYETGISGCLRSLLQGEQWTIPLNAREVLQAAATKRREAAVTSEPSGVPSGDGEEEEDEAAPERLLPPLELDEEQVRAVEMICANPVTVISGKGGCGKTTVVSLLFKAAIAQMADEIRSACAAFESDARGPHEDWGGDEEEAPPLSPPGFLSRLDAAPLRREGEGERAAVVHGAGEVLLTAPTGRAASLLTKKTCFAAYTLHQVVLSFMNTEKAEDGRPRNWKFKGVRVLVVDEGSLVSVQHLHSVLSMLTEYAQLRKFIILGDIRQLPSIQPGNALCDLFDSLKVRSCAIEMKTNHRAESQLIVDNAGLIADMGMKSCSYRDLEFDAVVDLNGPRKMAAADKKFIHICLPREESDDDLQNAIKLLIGSAPGLEDDNTSQFIAFRRVDVELINELCCKRYNNHTTKLYKNKLSLQLGDKVCCTKSGNVSNTEGVQQASDGGVEERLCNGEIFFIRKDVTVEEEGRPRKRYLTLDDGDGRVIKAQFKELQRECRLQHAWARTIHTFQGSEKETIVYVLGNSQAETWKHVYTAVTRGQKRVYVVAKREAVAAAIKRRVTPRHTRLSGLVKGALSRPGANGADAPAGPPAEAHGASLPGFIPVPSTSLSSAETPGTPPRVFTQAYSWSPDWSPNWSPNSPECHSNKRRNPMAMGMSMNQGMKPDSNNNKIEEATKRVREAQSPISAAIDTSSEWPWLQQQLYEVQEEAGSRRDRWTRAEGKRDREEEQGGRTRGDTAGD